MSDSPHPIDDELISAFVDDELSGAERQRFDQLLANRADYQEAVQEFTTLRRALQALPAYSLDGGFPQRVLEAAEERVRTPSTQQGSAAFFQQPLLQAAERALLTGEPQVDDSTHAAAVPGARHERPRWPRYWPALAAVATLVATLLFALVLPGPWQPRHVAQRGMEEPPLSRNTGLPVTEPNADVGDVAAENVDAVAATQAAQVLPLPATELSMQEESQDAPAVAAELARGGRPSKRETATKLGESRAEDRSIGAAGREFAGRAGAAIEHDGELAATATVGGATRRTSRVADQESAVASLNVADLDVIIGLNVDARLSDQDLSNALARHAIAFASTSTRQLTGGSLVALTETSHPALFASDESGGGGVTARGRQILDSPAVLTAEQELVYVEAPLRQVQGMLRELERHASRTDVLHVNAKTSGGVYFQQLVPPDKSPEAATPAAPADDDAGLDQFAGERIERAAGDSRDQAKVRDWANAAVRSKLARTPERPDARPELRSTFADEQPMPGPRGQVSASKTAEFGVDETEFRPAYAFRVQPIPRGEPSTEMPAQVPAPGASSGAAASEAAEQEAAEQEATEQEAAEQAGEQLLRLAPARPSMDEATANGKRGSDGGFAGQDLNAVDLTKEREQYRFLPPKQAASDSDVPVRVLIVLQEAPTSLGQKSALDTGAAAEADTTSATDTADVPD